MPTVRVTRPIAAEPEAVFDVFTRLREAPEHIRDITNLDVLTDGPIGAGTRFRETRVIFGREATEEMEITGFEPPQSYTVECTNHGAHYQTQYHFEPTQGGCAVTCIFTVTPLTFLAKLFSPLSSLMSRSLKECLSRDIEDLQRVLEPSATGDEQAA